LPLSKIHKISRSLRSLENPLAAPAFPLLFDLMAEVVAVSSPPNSTAPAVSRRVEAELTRLLYRLAGFGLFSNFALALLLAAGLFGHFPQEWTLLWLAALLAVSIARWLLNRAFARRPRTDAETGPWRTRFLIGLGVAGALWGVAD